MMTSTAAFASPARLCIRQCLVQTRSFAAKKADSKKGDVAKPKPSKVASSSAVPKKKGSTDAGGRPSDLQLVLAALDAPIRQEPPVPPEERERRHRIGRDYVIGRFRQHNELHHDLACKLQLKRHAVRMLPRNSRLREQALVIDDSGPPPWRKHAVWTPPIPGFDATAFASRDED